MVGSGQLREATDVKFDVPIQQEIFRVPDNFKIIDSKELLQDFEKAIGETLKQKTGE